jgi:hypothetical protein
MNTYKEVNGRNFERFSDHLYRNNYNIRYRELFDALIRGAPIRNFNDFITSIKVFIETNNIYNFFGGSHQGIALNNSLQDAFRGDKVAKHKMEKMYKIIYDIYDGGKSRKTRKSTKSKKTRKSTKTRKSKKTK